MGLAVHAAGRDELDVTDGAAVADTVARLAPRLVVNAAAYTAVDRGETEPAAAYAVNRDGPAHLARACALTGAPLVHVSTDYVFDGTNRAAYSEDDAVAPLGVYGASKLAGEEAVRAALDRHLILRTAWVYGVDRGNFVRTILRLGAERELLRVVDDQRGSPTAAADLAGAALAVARRLLEHAPPAGGFGTFHCAGGGETTWHGFAREIFRLAAARGVRVPRLEPITTADYPTPARRPANSVLDCARLARVYGIRLRPWRAALAETLDRILTAEAPRVGV
jgi:dTDP-4-dehydrorhamnose reductase